MELLLFDVGASVHAKSSSTTSEAVSLWSKLPPVAGFAEKDSLVAVDVGGIKHLAAHAALVAFLVESEFADSALFGGVHRLPAFWAFVLLSWFERHFGWSLRGNGRKENLHLFFE